MFIRNQMNKNASPNQFFTLLTTNGMGANQLEQMFVINK